MSDPVTIAGYARTAMGGFQGVPSGLKATELGSAAVAAAVRRGRRSGGMPIIAMIVSHTAHAKAGWALADADGTRSIATASATEESRERIAAFRARRKPDFMVIS